MNTRPGAGEGERKGLFRPGLHYIVQYTGLLTAAGAVACVGTVAGFFGYFFWLADLFAHFRVQYLLGLTLLSLLLLLAGRRKTVGIFLVFAAVNLALLLPLYLGGQSGTAHEGQDGPGFRVMLLNVNKTDGNPQRVSRLIRETAPDIIVLEEISRQWQTDLARLSRSFPHAVVRPREDNFGIGLFSTFPLVKHSIISPGRAALPTILAVVRIEQRDVQLIATHPMPPLGPELSRLRNEQLDQLPQYVGSSLPVILLGDLNTSPWSPHFKRLLQRTRLRNSMPGFGVQATWPDSNPFLRIPLDHVLHSDHIVVRNREVGPDAGSDHLPVIVDFSFNLNGFSPDKG
ncbi:MAG: endonuclease/exonuclease/phosphatase family protein [Candidatus Electrothrix sp. YB6]